MSLRAVVAALVLAAAVVWPALFAGELVLGRDLIGHFYPRLEAIGEAFARGVVPRWNPWPHAGAPWFGLRSGGVLYPGHLLFALLPLRLAMATFIAAHLALATEGARRLGAADRPGVPAAVVGLAYGLGGFTVSQYWALPHLVSGAWLPWALLGAVRLAEGRRRGAALLALGVGCQLLACEPQGALTTSALGAALAAARAPASGRPPARALGVAVGSVALGAALAGPQVLAMLLDLGAVDRTRAGFHDPRWGLAPAALLVDALAPGALGDRAFHQGGYWGAPLWSGLLPWCRLGIGALGLAAVVAGLASWRTLRPLERAGGALALLGVALAASPASYALALRFPAKWLVLTALGLALLAGAGAAARLERRAGRAGAAALVALLLAAVLASAVPPARLAAVLAGPAASPTAVGRAALEGALARAAVTAALALIVWRLAGGRWPARRRGLLLLGALALDLVTLARGEVRTTAVDLLARPVLADVFARVGPRPAGAPTRYAGSPERLAERVPAIPGLHPEEAREVFNHRLLEANEGFRHGIRYTFAFETVVEGPRSQLAGDPRVERLPLLERLARLDADLVLLTREELDGLGAAERSRAEPLGPVTGPRDVLLVRNRACPDWAYCVGAARPAASLAEAIAALADPALDVTARVTLGPEGAPGVTLDTRPRATVVVRAFEAERVELQVEADAPCWLVVRDAFSADWRASVDGAPAPIARADVLFRAVRLEAGRRVVVFSYHPRWWTPGIVASGVAAVALVLLARRGGGPPRAAA